MVQTGKGDDGMVLDERGIPVERGKNGIAPCPPKPCQLCTGNSAVRKADNTLMTSWEWCQDVNACAATIDWELVFRGES